MNSLHQTKSENCRIILVDDEKDFVDTLAKRLTHKGIFTVDVTYSGEEALDKIHNECCYDVAVVDVKMQGMDGLETLVQIKKQCPDVEVIFLTGHASIETGKEGVRKGAFDYMTKPVEFPSFWTASTELGKRSGKALTFDLFATKQTLPVASKTVNPC